MGRKKLTDEQKRDSLSTNKTKRFMKSVKEFLKTKSGGELPPEWECSLMLLEEYYLQFCKLTAEINELPSLIVMSRYGEVPSPLLAARDKSAVRLEAMMKQLGITFKEQQKMDIVQIEEEESPLSMFVKNKMIEKRNK